MHRRLAREIARIEKKYKNPLSEKELSICSIGSDTSFRKEVP
jgi:hypothetical protein